MRPEKTILENVNGYLLVNGKTFKVIEAIDCIQTETHRRNGNPSSTPSR